MTVTPTVRIFPPGTPMVSVVAGSYDDASCLVPPDDHNRRGAAALTSDRAGRLAIREGFGAVPA